jgi:outer membrane protein assembly factor BamD
MKFLKIFIVLIVFTCSCTNKSKKKQEDLKLYQNAISQIKKQRFTSAQDNLMELENEFPYSEYAAKAEILNSFISYLNKEYQEAHDLADKFIKLRPANEDIEYMYFLKSISLLELIKDKYRESETAIKTQRSFRELKSRFPNSIYNKISDNQLTELKNIIASHEIEIAKFYQFQQDYLPAILRYQRIVKDFPSSKYVPESLYRLAECYYSLGLIEEANSQIEEIQTKHKDSKWLKYAKKLKLNLTSNL